VNIGDIAHTPGLLRALQRFYPDANVVLWPCNIDHGAGQMLRRHFPGLQIVEGEVDENGLPVTNEVKSIWQKADFFLHGSGPGLVAFREARAWHTSTAKPYGFLGVTAERPQPEHVTAIAPSRFILTRDSISIQHLKEAGVVGPTIEFCPDATFACDLTDEAKGIAYCEEKALKAGEFVCMIPRLRYTPYYKIHGTERTKECVRRDTVNETFAQVDHAKMREAIIRVVRETNCKVLLCPEMTYQVDIMDELLYDALPDDVKPKVVVRRSYWLPDEAAAIYKRAASVVSFECHSPILALRHGVPVIYLRQPTDSIKGQMWRDVGLSKYILEIEDVSATQVADLVLEQLHDRKNTLQAMKTAINGVDATLERSLNLLRTVVSELPISS
jgi:polysaccharide pyruvyl transferase WcaK-like protein